MSNYGIPYMGSKDKIAPSIAMNFPAADNFYDLFGGGFSVTHYMLEHKAHKYKQFHFNEINNDIVELIKKAINGEYNYNAFRPAFISHDDFERLKKTDPYVRVCWSFGNKQKGYLFSKEIEPYKKSMHNAVVFSEFDDLARSTLGFGSWPGNVNSIKKRRIYLRRKIGSYRKTKIPRHLHCFLNEQQLLRLQQLERLERLEQLGRLERLEQLERRLVFYSDDYRKIDIKPNSVVYCDIPYKGTAEYLNTFNHQDFFDWAASRPFPVFVSEYGISDSRLKLIYRVEKKALFNSVDRKSKIEKLYWNGK